MFWLRLFIFFVRLTVLFIISKIHSSILVLTIVTHAQNSPRAANSSSNLQSDMLYVICLSVLVICLPLLWRRRQEDIDSYVNDACEAVLLARSLFFCVRKFFSILFLLFYLWLMLLWWHHFRWICWCMRLKLSTVTAIFTLTLIF